MRGKIQKRGEKSLLSCSFTCRVYAEPAGAHAVLHFRDETHMQTRTHAHIFALHAALVVPGSLFSLSLHHEVFSAVLHHPYFSISGHHFVCAPPPYPHFFPKPIVYTHTQKHTHIYTHTWVWELGLWKCVMERGCNECMHMCVFVCLRLWKKGTVWGVGGGGTERLWQ